MWVPLRLPAHLRPLFEPPDRRGEGEPDNKDDRTVSSDSEWWADRGAEGADMGTDGGAEGVLRSTKKNNLQN